jgi:glyoxylase-like metal-dependent hydrolase (beta-lactamase superfamily II)
MTNAVPPLPRTIATSGVVHHPPRLSGVAHPPAVEIAPGVVRIPTIGAASTNSFAFVDGDGSVTLVDCGLKRAPARIVAGLRAIGRHPGDVVRIVLTHAHTDHAGGAAEMAARTGAPVAVHEADADDVEAGRPAAFESSLLVGRLMTRLPGGGFPPVAVGERLTGGQVLDVGGGLRIVATPGHTPGHVSLLHEPTRTLVTGDALFNLRQLRYSPRPLCTDFRLNERTAHVLGELEYDRVAFTHGTEITTGAREAVRGFLSDAARTGG